MALPRGTTGSLSPTFVSARPVGLAVKLPSAFTLYARLPTALREPLRASVTLWEATAPVKLPTIHCPGPWLPKARALFSRSYEGILPSSFNIVLSSALVCSTSPPVSVSGTVYKLELFPGTASLHIQSDKDIQTWQSVTFQQAHEY